MPSKSSMQIVNSLRTADLQSEDLIFSLEKKIQIYNKLFSGNTKLEKEPLQIKLCTVLPSEKKSISLIKFVNLSSLSAIDLLIITYLIYYQIYINIALLRNGS